MIENIWGSNHFPSNRTVDNYIVRLRKLFDSDNSPNPGTNKKAEIKSVRGIGYMLSLKNEKTNEEK